MRTIYFSAVTHPDGTLSSPTFTSKKTARDWLMNAIGNHYRGSVGVVSDVMTGEYLEMYRDAGARIERVKR